MRSDLKLEPLNSRNLYNWVDIVYQNISGNGDIDLDYLDTFVFEGFAQHAAIPHKTTLLHQAIRGIVFFYLEYSTRKYPEDEIENYRALLSESGSVIPKWLNSELVRKHLHQLDRMLWNALDRVVPSVFFVLFSDRAFVGLFQQQISELSSRLLSNEYPDLLMSDGIFKRPRYIPTWLKAGIFHRDRGRCQHCWRDLTGLGMPIIDLHLDHIIPLAKSGTNDPTNFQLSCEKCNCSKGAKLQTITAKYSPYW